MSKRLGTVALLLLTLSGCVIGNTYDYQTAAPDLSVTTERSVTIGVLDRRSYVVSSDKSPDFVGLMRSGYGIPYNVTTESGQALSEDFAAALKIALDERGIDADVMRLPVPSTRAEALENFQSVNGGERFLLLIIEEWKTDTYVRVGLHYNLIAEVYAEDGTMLANNRVSGFDNLGAVMLPREVGPKATNAAQAKFGELLEAQEIREALR